MSMTLRLLARAIELAQAGRMVEARPLLLTVINAEPHNTDAWLWYVHTLAIDSERLAVVDQWLSIEPDNYEAQHLHAKLYAAVHQQSTGIQQRSMTARLARFLLAVLGVLLTASVIYLGVGNDRANRQLTDTTARLETLQHRFDQLQQNYRDLATQYNAVLGQYGRLKSDYDRLSVDYQAVRNQLTNLQARHDQLNSDYQAVRNQLTDSQARYAALEEKAIVPPYIYVHGREVTIAFAKNDKTIERWLVSMDWFERDITRTYTRKTVQLKNEGGAVFQILDFRQFIEPSPWTGVITQLYNEAGTEEAFIREAWNIVTQLTQWTEDKMGETPRFPFDTLLAGGGDCEDTSILLASFIKAAPVNWKVELFYMDLDHPTDPQTVNHVIVRVKTDSHDYYIETTTPDEMEPYRYIPTGWGLSAD